MILNLAGGHDTKLAGQVGQVIVCVCLRLKTKNAIASQKESKKDKKYGYK